ncbi:MAG: hypothetical protein IJA12_02520 [Oscillospiraceae bacterium]|nr:hypothetical protein [Oscillospiraceae bacterium]
METVNTNDINIKEIVDRMTKIKAEEKTLSEEYTLLQAQLQMIGESDLENTKRKSVSYLGNGSKATVTIADKVASILPALFKDIFGKAYSDLVTEKHTVELNAEGKRLVASIWNGDYCSGSVEEIVSKLDCDEKAKKSLLKKLNGKNYETDKKNLIKLGGLDEETAGDYAFLISEIVAYDKIQLIIKLNNQGVFSDEAFEQLKLNVNAAVCVEQSTKITVEDMS